MADNFGARTDGAYRVVCSAPDVCKLPNGSPVPFPITEKLSNCASYATKTNLNSKKTIMLKSHTSKVSGDEVGVAKGVKSTTTGSRAEPVEHSKSVNVEGSSLVRVGDKVYMNNKNTLGTVVFAPSPVQGAIQDNGAINVE